MMNENERKRRNQRKQDRRWGKIDAVVARMAREGWDPRRLDGHSVRYGCDAPGEGRRVVAIKTTGGDWSGALGFAQKKNGQWAPPMTNSDYLLSPIVHQGKLAVWKLSMPRVVERLEVVQQLYNERGRATNGALWMHIFARAPHGSYAPCQLDLADGAGPLWDDMPLPWATDGGEAPDELDEQTDGNRHSRGRRDSTEPPEEEVVPPSPLAGFTIGQLIDELQRRGLKSFSF